MRHVLRRKTAWEKVATASMVSAVKELCATQKPICAKPKRLRTTAPAWLKGRVVPITPTAAARVFGATSGLWHAKKWKMKSMQLPSNSFSEAGEASSLVCDLPSEQSPHNLSSHIAFHIISLSFAIYTHTSLPITSFDYSIFRIAYAINRTIFIIRNPRWQED